MTRHRTGDLVVSDGQKWYLIWLRGRDPSDGKEIWDAENELGESKLIWL
jgi:hypothetical protein